MNKDLETQTGRTMRRIRIEWQQEIIKDVRAAILAELEGDDRDNMLRQLTDIQRAHGL